MLGRGQAVRGPGRRHGAGVGAPLGARRVGQWAGGTSDLGRNRIVHGIRGRGQLALVGLAVVAAFLGWAGSASANTVNFIGITPLQVSLTTCSTATFTAE